MNTNTTRLIHLTAITAVIGALLSSATRTAADSEAPAAQSATVEGTESDEKCEHGVNHGSLAKQAQNPVANLISVPMQNNFNFGVGPTDGIQYQTLWQPVIPTPLSEDWNLINRFIVPAPVYQPRVSASQGAEWGIGDIQYQGFVSPAKPGKLTWGVGANLSFPSASADSLGSGKWSAGPSIVVLTMPGQWVLGSLVSQTWSFAGDDDRSGVSLGTWQYFLNYNIPKTGGWYLTSSPTMTANWNAPGRDQFTIPVGGGVGKIFHIGKQHMNAKIQAFGYPVKPSGGPEWGLQFQLTLLFPR